MTFHQRDQEAAAFTEKIPKSGAKLYVDKVFQQSPGADRGLPKASIDTKVPKPEAGRHVPPDRFRSA
ncbi:hypothetical protein [Streptomyces sp. NPDC017993]|uniref:hypothetical protein n=1 Tax=Streptomyces sp. NPDC017993 TaxID=3365027 RepID=UPI0037A2C496